MNMWASEPPAATYLLIRQAPDKPDPGPGFGSSKTRNPSKVCQISLEIEQDFDLILNLMFMFFSHFFSFTVYLWIKYAQKVLR